MYTRVALALALVFALARPVFADDGRISGFVTYGDGELRGRVTDHDGDPLPRISVHLVSHTGAERVVKTDRDGRYHAALSGGVQTFVFVPGDVRIEGHVGVSTKDEAGEGVTIHEAVPPAIPAMPHTPNSLVIEYSKVAIDRDAWTRAWLLLDVSEAGAVTRLKLLRAPGFDLDRIAVREGLRLRFEPARDRADRPIRAFVMWSFEWPSYTWLRGRAVIPPEVRSVPCRGSGPTRSYYRDCSRPEHAKLVTAQWIDHL